MLVRTLFTLAGTEREPPRSGRRRAGGPSACETTYLLSALAAKENQIFNHRGELLILFLSCGLFSVDFFGSAPNWFGFKIKGGFFSLILGCLFSLIGGLQTNIDIQVLSAPLATLS